MSDTPKNVVDLIKYYESNAIAHAFYYETATHTMNFACGTNLTSAAGSTEADFLRIINDAIGAASKPANSTSTWKTLSRGTYTDGKLTAAEGAANEKLLSTAFSASGLSWTTVGTTVVNNIVDLIKRK